MNKKQKILVISVLTITVSIIIVIAYSVYMFFWGPTVGYNVPAP